MAIQRTDLTNRVRQDLLYRLRWNIFATLDQVVIATGSTEPVNYVSLFSHQLADESVTEPPLNRIDQVHINDCSEKASRQNRCLDNSDDETYGHVPPPPLDIFNEDGSSVTLWQFVTKVHAYLNEHVDEIKKVKSELYGKRSSREDGTQVNAVTYGQHYPPLDVRFYFSRIWAVAVDEAVCVSQAVGRGRAWKVTGMVLEHTTETRPVARKGVRKLVINPILDLLATWIAYHLARSLYNVSPWRPLSHVPGPKLAAASLLYEFWFDMILGGAGQEGWQGHPCGNKLDCGDFREINSHS